MRYNGHTTIYLLTFIFFIIGALLYFFKADLFVELEDYLIEDVSIQQEIKTSSTEDLLDLSLLNSSRVKNMESHIPYFKFENLGRTAPTDMVDLDLPIFSSVLPRNNQPIQ